MDPEWSKPERENIYTYIYTYMSYLHIYVGSRKMILLPIFRVGIETHREYACGHMEEGEGGVNWEIRMDV